MKLDINRAHQVLTQAACSAPCSVDHADTAAALYARGMLYRAVNGYVLSEKGRTALATLNESNATYAREIARIAVPRPRPTGRLTLRRGGKVVKVVE